MKKICRAIHDTIYVKVTPIKQYYIFPCVSICECKGKETFWKDRLQRIAAMISAEDRIAGDDPIGLSPDL